MTVFFSVCEVALSEEGELTAFWFPIRSLLCSISFFLFIVWPQMNCPAGRFAAYDGRLHLFKGMAEDFPLPEDVVDAVHIVVAVHTHAPLQVSP